MRWAILGPFQVHDDADREVPIPGSRLRTLLAALLLRANNPVGIDELCDVLWDGEPPPDAARTVRVYVLRLRRALGPAAHRLVTKAPGYLVRVGDGELDLLEFETACGKATAAVAARAWQAASDEADRALGLWRDRPLADVPSDRLRATCLPYLEQLRLQILDRRGEAELGRGRHAEAIPRLRELVDAHPLYERFHAQLIVALARSGRRGEALAEYQSARKVLVSELGIEPGAELRELHQRILAGDEFVEHDDRDDAGVLEEPEHAGRPITAGEAVERGSLATTAFVTGRFERLRSWFAGPMAEVATVEFLAGIHADLVARNGRFQRLAGMPGVRRTGAGVIVEVPLVYEHARLKSRVTLDEAGRIRGFYVLNMDAP